MSDDERLIGHMRDALVLARIFITNERDAGRVKDSAGILQEIDAVLTLARSHARQPRLSEAKAVPEHNNGGDDE